VREVNRRKNPVGRPSLASVLELLDEEVELLHNNLGGLPRAVEADQVLRQIWIDDVHNSTAIEGNTMTRAQVEDLVEHRRASRLLVETLEVEGYARAADWVYRIAPDYSHVPLNVVQEAHRLAVELAWAVEPPPTQDRPGSWRTTGVALRGVNVALPAAVHADLQEWSRSTRRRGDRHPITHAAEHHASFERIHPFVDGNGRVGRLLLNFLLLQQGYPPAVILAEKRRQYLLALRTADNGNMNPLTEVVARAVSSTLSRFLIPKLAGEAKLVPLTALAATSGYSSNYLRQLAQSGKLRAIREGRLWLSSKSWLDEYIKCRDPRGGPPGQRRRR
jgi:cell filamentation protein, protein adenylyltransferase